MSNLSDSVYSELIARLAERGETVCAAESLTAGLFCATLATVPGASVALRGGAVTYATECKHLLADVPVDILEKFGPVAAVTAQHMAFGIRQRSKSDWGVSLTGVAGPTEQDGHPVGEVWCGIAAPSSKSAQDAVAVKLGIEPSLGRNEIREKAVIEAARALLERL